MGNVLTYSGLTTKTRAMQSRLITEKQIEEILHFTSLSTVGAYLKKTEEYKDELQDLDETLADRETLENRIRISVFQNFSRLYHFAGQRQRKFLDLYGKRYEIRVLKELITNIFDHRKTSFPNLTPYEIYFYRHSGLDLKKLSACSTMEELIYALKGKEYFIPLSAAAEGEDPKPFDYSMALDLYYFSLIWKERKKLFKGDELKEITRGFGEQFDMLNLQFLRRSMRHAGTLHKNITDLLIPVHYKLKEAELKALAEAGSREEFDRIFETTWYGRKFKESEEFSLETFFNYLLRVTLTRQAKKDPYSVATLFSYLYLKEREVTQLIIAVECVSYGTPPEEAIRYIRSN
ncbi:MAG: V-type ATPase subunit [Clostridiales bacterium]|nr:V-type ATPase subunit [Candidatus Blautia equi]